MTDILIRDLPEEVVSEIDTKAENAGLSRTEYLRRVLVREQADSQSDVTIASLAKFVDTFRDLEREDVMGDAWSS